METLLRIGLSNAAAAFVLSLAVVIVACVWRRPAVLHALWLLVLVKLVTPPILWLPEPWAGSADPTPPARAWARTPDAAPADDAAADPPRLAVLPPGPAALSPSDPTSLPIPNPPPDVFALPAVVEAPSASAPAAPGWVAWAFGAWLAGSLAWYALALGRLRRFGRLLRHAAPAPESLRQRTQRLAEKLGLRRRPGVWLVPGRIAPMLWAAGGRPRVLFPSGLLDQTTPEQQNALLLHELAHLRRRDHWVRWLELVAGGLYWWNPVLWIARCELRQAEEQCCDAWVTSALPGAGKTYATALLATLDFLSEAAPAAPPLASGIGRVTDLKRRLTMILRGTTPRAMSRGGLLAVVGVGALLLPLLPAWARAQPPAKPEAPPNQPPVAVLKFVIAADPAPAAPEDIAKAKAELKELEDQLAKKQAEVADLAAKARLLRVRLAQAEAPTGARAILELAAPDANPDALKDLAKWLQTSPLPGAPGQVIVVDKATGKILMDVKEPDAPAPIPVPTPEFVPQYGLRVVKPGEWVVVPLPPPGAGVAAVPPPPAPAPADADKRIDELEKQLKVLMDQVEQMRREQKPAAPPAYNVPPPLHSYGPTPPEKVPFLDRLFVNVGPSAVPDQEHAKAEAAAKEAELDAIRAQAEAELRASQERVKQLEARLEELKKAAAEPTKP